MVRYWSVLTKGAFTPASFSSVESYQSSFPPLVRFVWAGVKAAIALGCAPKDDQTSVPRPAWRGGLGTLSNELWSSSFVVRTWSDLEQTQLQKVLIIFGLNQLRCALWDEKVFVDSLHFSMAARGLMHTSAWSYERCPLAVCSALERCFQAASALHYRNVLFAYCGVYKQCNRLWPGTKPARAVVSP